MSGIFYSGNPSFVAFELFMALLFFLRWYYKRNATAVIGFWGGESDVLAQRLTDNDDKEAKRILEQLINIHIQYPELKASEVIETVGTPAIEPIIEYLKKHRKNVFFGKNTYTRLIKILKHIYYANNMNLFWARWENGMDDQTHRVLFYVLADMVKKDDHAKARLLIFLADSDPKTNQGQRALRSLLILMGTYCTPADWSNALSIMKEGSKSELTVVDSAPEFDLGISANFTQTATVDFQDGQYEATVERLLNKVTGLAAHQAANFPQVDKMLEGLECLDPHFP